MFQLDVLTFCLQEKHLRFVPYVIRYPTDSRHSSALLLGDDLFLRALWELRGLRRPGQHLLHLLPEDT